ncbi:MAG: EAL domain-containing protein [Betaproteobacteria bacterium]|nr:EAL domain-containing protein [Betaproteobacteria bacterium]
MTLFKQLFFGASLLFLLVLAGVEAIYLSNARLYVQQQLESHSQDAATSLSLWLATVHPFEDRALIETVVNSTFDRGYYQSIRVVSVSGETLVAKQLAPAQGEVPVWFTRFFPLRPPAAESLISSGWRQLGRVLVSSHPNFAYLQLWHTGLQTLALLLLVYALALVALRAFLTTILRPLAEIERAATAIGERDFRTIALAPKARELGRVVAAMNSLSGKVRRFIEDESARAEQLQREAYRDPVTDLFNRRGLEHQLQGLFRAERDVFSGVFVLLELERFKEYNLHHGYQRADELLALVAQTITSACADQATVRSRFGGASFAVAAVNIDASAAGVLTAAISSRVESALAEQALTGEIQFHCGAAHFDAGAPALPELLAAADLALTRAQEKGPDTFDLVELAELDRRGRGSLAWREHLEGAIETGKLALYTQTVLSLPGRALMQSEVVTRILEDGSNPVPAAQFLPMAARHGLMPRLDCRVLEMLIARIDAGASLAPVIAVNISAQTVADAASRRRLIDALRGRRDIAARLVFEMTEFGVIRAPAQSLGFAAEIRRLGAQFAIDNFNLHRDSLRLLRELLPHYIKLAPAYTNALAENEDSRFIVSSLMRIAQPLEIRIIAQAVESESLILLLGEIGFAGYQGYANGRPVPIG